MPHKKLFLSLLTLFFLQITVAQKLNAIDQKGTKIEIINNKVTTASTAPSSPNTNDIWFDSKVTTAGTLPTVNIFDGKKWVSLEHKGKPGSIFFASSDSIPTENNSQLFWDKNNDRLGVGTNTPSDKLTVNGSISSKGISNTGAISNSGLFTNGSGINNTGTITNTGSITNSVSLTNGVGTAAAPSYNFTGAPTTGLFYRPNSDPTAIGALGFSVGGNESFNIDNSQQVNFLKNVRLAGKLLDGASSAGTAGQVLSSTGTTPGTLWIDPKLVMVINKTSDYILTASDNGKVFTFDKVSLVKLKVPTGLPIGFNISVYQIGDGNVLFMPEESTSVKVYNRLMRLTTAGKNAGAGLLITETNTAHITGDLKK